jgi:hypothetical protein
MDKVKAGISAGITKFREVATDSMNQFPFWAFAIIVLISIACLVVHIILKGDLVNANNIRNKAAEGHNKAASIVLSTSGRKSLTKYLSTISSDPKTILLSNFYFSTVNATGLFFPSKSGVFSPNAVRFAAKGGARAFVLDIWSSMEPFGGFKPILQSIEEGSKWRRVSMNSMNVETALDAIISEIYTPSMGNEDYKDDVVLLYFRFNGGIRNPTYDDLAKTCARILAPYKLDPAFSSFRGNKILFKTPITDLQGKVVIISSKTQTEMETEYLAQANERGDTNTKNPLIPFMNLCSQDSIPVEIDINGLNTMVNMKNFIKDSIVFVAPPDYSNEATTNNWGDKLKICRDNGIHCMAMNMFAPGESGGFADFLFNDYFKEYSYRLKDEVLRVDPTVQEPPKSTGDTGVATEFKPATVTTGTFGPTGR